MPYKDVTAKRAYDRDYWLKVKGRGPAPISAAMNRAVDIVKPLDIVVPKHGLRIAYIPDCQLMDGVPMEHLSWAGQYLARKRPDVIVCGGDFGDFPSLSRFGRGTRKFEGLRYKKDLAAFHEGMELLLTPIKLEAGYTPRLEFTEGNHESHIERATQEWAFLDGLISRDDLKLEEYGWRVHDFLHPVSIGGVAFCHYFPSGVMGRPITTAPELLRKLHMSAVAGHQQGREIAFGRRADGGNMTAIITGSFYQHTVDFLSPFSNAHWRGLLMMHEVRNGQFDEMFVSIDFLKRKFG
jgi:hypothetical protein